ncbi:MAG TPA: nucleotidyltransferase domain-containing protein [Spirochaetota bacterium]|nr:nucleotidyltransferase domain-containing protein [Spirochaetota bacterium]
MEKDLLINQITDRLHSLNPYKVVLFGSWASGEPHDDSDCDLIVVLSQTGFPLTYREKMENHRLVRRSLRDLNEELPFDVIVYTIDEWNSFIERGSSFSREIIREGKSIA